MSEKKIRKIVYVASSCLLGTTIIIPICLTGCSKKIVWDFETTMTYDKIRMINSKIFNEKNPPKVFKSINGNFKNKTPTDASMLVALQNHWNAEFIFYSFVHGMVEEFGTLWSALDLPPNQYDLLEIHFACSLNQKGNREIVNLNIDANGVFDGGPLTVTFRSTQTHTLIFQANTFNDDEQDENSKNIMVLGTFIPEGQDIPLDSVYFTTNISYGHTILPQRNLSFVELIWIEKMTPKLVLPKT